MQIHELINCYELHCYHPFTLHRTQSITNRKWQRRSPGARANWPVDLNKLDQLISSPLFAWSWQNLFCGKNWQLGLFRKSWFQKFRIPLKQKLLTQSFARSLITCTVCKSVLHIKANYDLYSSTDRTPSKAQRREKCMRWDKQQNSVLCVYTSWSENRIRSGWVSQVGLCVPITWPVWTG